MKLTIKDEKRICELYKIGENGYSLAKKFNIHPVTVYRIIRKYGFKVKSISQAKTIYSIDEALFDIIDCEWKAYFLGLLYADGCVYRNNIKLALQEQDKEILDKLNTLIFNNEKELSFCKAQQIIINNKTYIGNNKYLLEISNKKIADKIRLLGCIPKKSLVLKFPTEEQVSPEFIRHFIRGYFDGDGTVFNRKNSKRICVKILGSKFFIPELNNLIKSVLGIKLNIIHRDNILSAEIYNQENIKLFFHYLYDNSEIFLNRKKIKFIESIL